MVNILYNTIVLEPFTFFYVICDCVTMTVTCNGYVTVCDIILTSNPKFKIFLYSQQIFIMLIALLLSINNIISCFCKRDASSKNNDNYIIYYIAINTIIYTVSIINITIVFYLFVNYKTSFSFIQNICLSVDYSMLQLLVQLESAKSIGYRP